MVEKLRSREGNNGLKVMLINMEGESFPSLHEPIGIESIASKVLENIPNIVLDVYDTQPELVATGKINTDELALRIRRFASRNNQPLLLGIGVPICSWDYTKSLLIKLEDNPPCVPTTIVLGNAIPTFADPDEIKRHFPYVKLVRGEGEESFASIADDLINGKQAEDVLVFQSADLSNSNHPYRVLTRAIKDLGGSVKIEASRGCIHGSCTFCSRCFRGGKDYRPVNQQTVVSEIQNLLDQFDITRFELTDEEAFGDIEATKRLISIIKSSNLPRIAFTASLRVDILNKLEEEGLLDQLKEIGLDKVFLGVEGGSDDYLRQLAKGQTVDEAKRAIAITKKKGFDLELGFITFSWRMSFDMLRANVEFLSEDGNAQYVSSLLNNLEVRKGSLDEKLLKRYVAQGKIRGYDPDENLSINFLCYRKVPFLDQRVEYAYTQTAEFAKSDAKVYYALKSLTRSKSLPDKLQQDIEKFYFKLKGLHLRMLRHLVGIEEDLEIPRIRRELMEKVKITLDSLASESSTLALLRREVDVFLKEETERTEAKKDQKGSLFVFFDKENKVLLVRPRNDELWAFPGGNVKEDENAIEAGEREVREELGVSKVKVISQLPTITKFNHYDMTTGERSKLILNHYLASFEDDLNIQSADHEIVDTLWLSPKDILSGRVAVRPNVKAIMNKMKKTV